MLPVEYVPSAAFLETLPGSAAAFCCTGAAAIEGSPTKSWPEEELGGAGVSGRRDAYGYPDQTLHKKKYGIDLPHY